MRVLFGPDPIEFGEGRRHWICSNCGRTERWGKTWRAYASEADEDAAEIPFVVCSEDCAKGPRGILLEACAETLGRRGIGGHYDTAKLYDARRRLRIES